MNGVDSTVAYVVEKLGAGVEALATSLQVPAAHVYEILVRQAVVMGITELVWTVGGGIMAYAATRLLRYGFKLYAEKDDIFIPCFMFGGTGTLIGFLIFGASVTDAIRYLVNPEYYAIKEILQVLQ